MAKIVIAGSADCAYYAKIELLTDKLVKNLPDFNLHKITIQPTEWEDWLESTCEERGWRHHRSPIVWRELVDRGGKGLLIGGSNEFQEYVNGYYGNTSLFTSRDMRLIAGENTQTKSDIDDELKQFQALCNPIHVCITNAASLTAYNMMSLIAKGEAFGCNTEVALHLLDTSDNQEILEGSRMEAFDLACPLLRQVDATSDPAVAFKDCTAVIILDELLQRKDDDGEEEETRDEWLKRNNELFVSYSRVLNEVARKDVRVIIAGNGPVNFNTYITIQNTPNLARQNIVGVSRNVERRAKTVLANRLVVNSGGVVDVVVWGNTNRTTFVDTTNARVHLYDGAVWGPPWYSRSIKEMVHDDKWMGSEYLDVLARRRVAMETEMKHVAGASLATAVVTNIDHWWNGSPAGQYFSMAVCSEGWYEIPEGLVFSFPVTMGPPGYWTVVQDIELSDENKNKIKEIVAELQAEIEVIYPVAPPTPAAVTPLPDTPADVTPPTSEPASRTNTPRTEGASSVEHKDNESVVSKVFGEEETAVDGPVAENSPPEETAEDTAEETTTD